MQSARMGGRLPDGRGEELGADRHQFGAFRHLVADAVEHFFDLAVGRPVSYTHLTLPTSDLV